jgi:hypothetical protein
MIPKSSGYKLSFVKMILAKETENPNMPLEYIEGYTGIANNVTLELPVALKEGDYVVFIEIDWVQN